MTRSCSLLDVAPDLVQGYSPEYHDVRIVAASWRRNAACRPQQVLEWSNLNSQGNHADRYALEPALNRSEHQGSAEEQKTAQGGTASWRHVRPLRVNVAWSVDRILRKRRGRWAPRPCAADAQMGARRRRTSCEIPSTSTLCAGHELRGQVPRHRRVV